MSGEDTAVARVEAYLDAHGAGMLVTTYQDLRELVAAARAWEAHTCGEADLRAQVEKLTAERNDWMRLTIQKDGRMWEAGTREAVRHYEALYSDGPEPCPDCDLGYTDEKGTRCTRCSGKGLVARGSAGGARP